MRQLDQISSYSGDSRQVLGFFCSICGKNHLPEPTEGRGQSPDIVISKKSSTSSSSSSSSSLSSSLSNLQQNTFTKQQESSVFSDKKLRNNLSSYLNEQYLLKPTSSIIKHKVSTNSFDLMLARIKKVFDAPDNNVDIDIINDILLNYESNRDDWSMFTFYEHNKFKRNLVDEHPKYNVMIITWGGSAKSQIHDHSESHCFMKHLDGHLRESRFDWPKGNNEHMRLKSETYMRKNHNEVIYIHDKVGLHKVENAEDYQTAATLHIYIPPYKSCYCFDETSGKANLCKVHFHSRKGNLETSKLSSSSVEQDDKQMD